MQILRVGAKHGPGACGWKWCAAGSSAGTSCSGDRGRHESLGCTRVCTGLCARGVCGHLCTWECTCVHACCVGALCVCMSVCVCPFTLSKEVFP